MEPQHVRVETLDAEVLCPYCNKLRGKKDLLRAGRGPSRGMKRSRTQLT